MSVDRSVPRGSKWLRYIDGISYLLAIIAAITCAVLTVHVVVSVISRYFFGANLPGTLDMTAHVWMPSLIALALGYALLRAEHIRVDLLTDGLGPRGQRIIEIVSMAALLLVVGVLAWYTADNALAATAFDERAVSTRWVLIWPVRWVVVLGLLGLLLQTVAQLVRAVRSDESTTAGDQVEEAL